MPRRQLLQLANLLQTHLLQEYPTGHRLVTTRDRYLHFANDARKRQYRTAAPPSPQPQRAAAPQPPMQPPLQHTVAPEKPASPPPSTEKKAAVPKKATHSLPAASSHSEMRKLIESCGHTLNQKPPSDAEAQARRRHWVLDSAAVLLLCDEPEEAERAFYERMIQGISQRLAPAALITTAEAAIWGGWNQLVFGKQVKLLLLSHSISVLELEFTLRSLPLLTHEQYKDVAPRKELWENIQAFFE